MEDGWRVPARKFTRQQNFNETASLRTPTPFSSYYPPASDSPPLPACRRRKTVLLAMLTKHDVASTRERHSRSRLAAPPRYFSPFGTEGAAGDNRGKTRVERTGASVRSFEKALTSAWPRAMISSLSAPAKVSQGATAAPLSGKLTVARTTVDSSLFESCRRNTRHVQPGKKFKHF